MDMWTTLRCAPSCLHIHSLYYDFNTLATGNRQYCLNVNSSDML